MLERDVIKRTNDWAKKQGVQYIRAHYGRGAAVGWPDFIYLIPGGRPLFIEFKATGKRATRTQEWRIRILEELGYDVEVCDSPEGAKSAIEEAIRKAG
jgi:hypothetical protein